MTKSGMAMDRGAWAVGGGTMVGLGVGFFFLTTSVFWFIACLLIGIGAGLLTASLLSSRQA